MILAGEKWQESVRGCTDVCALCEKPCVLMCVRLCEIVWMRAVKLAALVSYCNEV
jgi:hypothetical protein